MKYTTTQIEFLKDGYTRMSAKDLTAAFNEKFNSNKSYPAIRIALSSHKITTSRAGGRAHCPVGSERVTTNGRVMISVDEPNPWDSSKSWFRDKHIVLWEKVNGPLPHGHVLAFIDSDKSNCELDNLMLLSRGEMLYLNVNKYKELPTELRPVMRGIARVFAAARSAEELI